MSRYRLYPTPEQETILRKHCAHARFVWNLAIEQHSWWRPGRKSGPGYLEQSRQLTDARRQNPWLAAGSHAVQQQALRDFDRARGSYFAGTHRRPTWRKAGRNEGFRVVAVKPRHIRRLNRRTGQVWIPKAGWVRFRWSRLVPEAKSYRVNLDRAGRWHVALAAIPESIPGPGTGEVVGIDRGVVVPLALSNGETYRVPAGPDRTGRLQRRLARAKRGSNRRQRVKIRLARARAREADRRKDWAEKASTDLARRFDVIRVEDLKVRNMTRSAKGTIGQPGRNVRAKAGLNRAILAVGWGLVVRRLEDKAPGRVEKVNPAFTSQTCSACGTRNAEARESQAVFACRSCGHAENADVNAAKNIAAGHAVTARGGVGAARPANREPQRAA